MTIEAKTSSATDPRIAPVRSPSDTVLALIDQSRLRRECLKLALAQHNARWRVIDMASAQEALRLAEAGQRFDLVIDTSESSQRFSTDCEICCRPFEVAVECEPCKILSLDIQAE